MVCRGGGRWSFSLGPWKGNRELERMSPCVQRPLPVSLTISPAHVHRRDSNLSFRRGQQSPPRECRVLECGRNLQEYLHLPIEAIFCPQLGPSSISSQHGLPAVRGSGYCRLSPLSRRPLFGLLPAAYRRRVSVQTNSHPFECLF